MYIIAQKLIESNCLFGVMIQVSLEEFKRKQLEFLNKFRSFKDDPKIAENLHDLKFDWFQFPCDSGSYPQYLMRSEADIEELKADKEW